MVVLVGFTYIPDANEARNKIHSLNINKSVIIPLVGLYLIFSNLAVTYSPTRGVIAIKYAPIHF